MADIFISYAREDREAARKLATLLEARGWSVWWDRNIPLGKTFDQVIEGELNAAKNVIVLWSANSISSEWVRSEASVAAERGILIPAALDNSNVPLEFRRRQTASLVGWKGEAAHEGIQAICEAVSGMKVAAVQLPPEAGRRASATTPPAASRFWTFAIGGVFVLGIVIAVLWGLMSSPQTPPASRPPEAADPPRPAPTPRPPVGDPQSASGAHCVISVGAYSTEENANQLRKKLMERGFTAFVISTSRPSGVLYQVFVGPLGNRVAADDTLRRLKSVGINGRVDPDCK